MFCPKCKCCRLSWWSGFFGLAAAAHLIRLIVRVPLEIGTQVVPMGLSVAVVIVAGTLSLVFCKAGGKACNCST